MKGRLAMLRTWEPHYGQSWYSKDNYDRYSERDSFEFAMIAVVFSAKMRCDVVLLVYGRLSISLACDRFYDLEMGSKG